MVELIDQLPRDTKYREALSLDVELAEAYMASPEAEQAEDDRPRMSDDSPEVMLLRDVANQLRILNTNTVAANGGNPGKPDFLKGPRTAVEMAEHRRRYRDHISLAARLLPHKREQLLGEISGD